MILYIPLATKRKSRRLKIYEVNGECCIREERLFRNGWREDPDMYYTLYFPMENISDVIKELQRFEKFLILK